MPQDDVREQQMTNLFNLTVAANRSRADVDAHLRLQELDELIPFELKSTTSNSVSTVRDFGPEHIAKWQKLHWLFAFYQPDGTTLKYCYYGSPADMHDWIADKERYIRPDMIMAEEAQSFVSDSTLASVLGDATNFSATEARRIMKNQWSAADYRTNADLEDHRYSRVRMVGLLQERLAYVIRRGATLNNPHIAEGYFAEKGLPQITDDHAATVRTLVRAYLADARPLEPLDPAVAAQASAADTAEPTA